jgi:mRNA interferase MazF
MKTPKRGEIWVVNLDPTVGSEISKKRPAVIISNDINNVNADTVTVIPVTSSTQKIYPCFEQSV